MCYELSVGDNNEKDKGIETDSTRVAEIECRKKERKKVRKKTSIFIKNILTVVFIYLLYLVHLSNR